MPVATTAHCDLKWAGQPDENPLSVSAKKFDCTFNPCDISIEEKEVQIQQHPEIRCLTERLYFTFEV